MEHCRSPDGVTSISVRPYYTMLSRVYLALAMGFLVNPESSLLASVSRVHHTQTSIKTEMNDLCMTITRAKWKLFYWVYFH